MQTKEINQLKKEIESILDDNKALNSIASKKLKQTDWIYINSKKINISSSLIRKFW